MKKLSHLFTFLTVLILNSGVWAQLTDLEVTAAGARSQCLTSLVQSDYFKDQVLLASDHRPSSPRWYELSSEGIKRIFSIGSAPTEAVPIWLTKDFLNRGDIVGIGGVFAVTRDTQILLLGKLLEKMRTDHKILNFSQQLRPALEQCLAADQHVPYGPNSSLYSGQLRRVPDLARELIKLLQERSL